MNCDYYTNMRKLSLLYVCLNIACHDDARHYRVGSDDSETIKRVKSWYLNEFYRVLKDIDPDTRYLNIEDTAKKYRLDFEFNSNDHISLCGYDCFLSCLYEFWLEEDFDRTHYEEIEVEDRFGRKSTRNIKVDNYRICPMTIEKTVEYLYDLEIPKPVWEALVKTMDTLNSYILCEEDI